MSESLTYKSKHVQHLRRLLGRRSARYEHRQFVVEGANLIREALTAGWPPVAEYGTDEGPFVCNGDCPAHVLADGVIERVATTTTPQPNLAIFEMENARPDLSDFDRLMVTDRLNDPGNLGTILRSSEAAGLDAVVTTPGSVDPYNPKVVRSSAGAIFYVPVVEATLDRLRDDGFTLVGTSSHRGDDYLKYRWPTRTAIVLGPEAQGLSDDDPVDDWVTIPHRGRAESLNVAMAATLLGFAVASNHR